jgi:hypothetical protein
VRTPCLLVVFHLLLHHPQLLHALLHLWPLQCCLQEGQALRELPGLLLPLLQQLQPAPLLQWMVLVQAPAAAALQALPLAQHLSCCSA